MKSKTMLLLGTLTLLFAVHSFASTAPAAKDVTVPINNVFVPGGFDSSSDAYVVASGIFPNGCYKWKEATRNDISNFEHEFTSVATVNPGMCIMVLVPFTRDIRLGQLEVGTHTLRFLSGDGTYLEKTLTIE